MRRVLARRRNPQMSRDATTGVIWVHHEYRCLSHWEPLFRGDYISRSSATISRLDRGQSMIRQRAKFSLPRPWSITRGPQESQQREAQKGARQILVYFSANISWFLSLTHVCGGWVPLLSVVTDVNTLDPALISAGIYRQALARRPLRFSVSPQN